MGGGHARTSGREVVVSKYRGRLIWDDVARVVGNRIVCKYEEKNLNETDLPILLLYE